MKKLVIAAVLAITPMFAAPAQAAPCTGGLTAACRECIANATAAGEPAQYVCNPSQPGISPCRNAHLMGGDGPPC